LTDVRRVSLLAVLCLLLSSCWLSSANERQLTVVAASSLSGALTTIAEHFEADHPGTEIALSFGSSSTLATQVMDGASADIIATASPESMEPVVQAGLTESPPTTFATNEVAVALPADNPGQLHRLADLEREDVKVAVCVRSAPCGGVAADLFETAGLSLVPVTEEVDVKTVLAKVVAGEVDAGIVYASDVLAAGPDVDSLAIPEPDRVTTDYLVTSLTTTSDPPLADEFVEAMLFSDGQRILADAGFHTP
jgi:molybdate transport system substrate-binding protein